MDPAAAPERVARTMNYRGASEQPDRAVLILVDLLVFLMTLVAVLLVRSDAHTPARGILVLAVFVFVPGWVVCRLHPTMALSERFAVAVAVSIALSAIGSAIQLASHHWVPFGAFDVLAATSLVGLGAIELVEHRSRRSKPLEEPA